MRVKAAVGACRTGCSAVRVRPLLPGVGTAILMIPTDPRVVGRMLRPLNLAEHLRFVVTVPEPALVPVLVYLVPQEHTLPVLLDKSLAIQYIVHHSPLVRSNQNLAMTQRA